MEKKIWHHFLKSLAFNPIHLQKSKTTIIFCGPSETTCHLKQPPKISKHINIIVDVDATGSTN